MPVKKTGVNIDSKVSASTHDQIRPPASPQIPEADAVLQSQQQHTIKT